eukprot:XP_011439203.2 PREDICTED: uncharacterized protein LOC105336542 [Crassostrea gigas]
MGNIGFPAVVSLLTIHLLVYIAESKLTGFDSAKPEVSKGVNGLIKRKLQEPSNTEDEKPYQPTELKPFVRENGKWQSNNYVRLSGGRAKQKSPRMAGYWRRPGSGSRPGRPNRWGRPGRPGRPSKPGRPGRWGRPSRPGRRPSRPGRRPSRPRRPRRRSGSRSKRRRSRSRG